MQPHMSHKRTRTDYVLTWWNSLGERDARPRRRTRLLPATLVLAAAASVAGMPLVWHRLVAPAFIYYGPPQTTLINGLGTASWLLAVAACALILAVRAYRRIPDVTARWAVTVVAFATVNGMFIDYFDWNTRGVSIDVRPYYGPGFYVGLGAAGLMVAAAILAWRTSD